MLAPAVLATGYLACLSPWLFPLDSLRSRHRRCDPAARVGSLVMLMRTDITDRRCDFALVVGDRTGGQRARKREGVAQLRKGMRPASMRDRLNQWMFSGGADTHDHTLPSHGLQPRWRESAEGASPTIVQT
jgi:hypothetical protein